MLGYMFIQITFVSTAIRTMWTSEWLLSCMGSNMSLEIAFNTKTCWTQVACKWLFSCVRSHVSFNSKFIRSPEWTIGATMWLVSFMSVNMFVILALWKLQGTVWALKKLLACVRVEQRVCCSGRSKCRSRMIAAFDCHLKEMFLLFTADRS